MIQCPDCGDLQVLEEQHVPLPVGQSACLRRVQESWSVLLFCAMDQPTTRLVVGLLPFELGRLVPYDPHLLADWAAALYRRDVEEVMVDAYDSMLEAAIRRTNPSPYERLRGWNVRRWYQIITVTYQLVLLPVWMIVLVCEGKRVLAVVNGQTARVALATPLPGHSLGS